MEKDVDKITHKVGKQVKKIRKSDDVEKGVIALANRVGVCQVLLYFCSVDYNLTIISLQGVFHETRRLDFF